MVKIKYFKVKNFPFQAILLLDDDDQIVSEFNTVTSKYFFKRENLNEYLRETTYEFENVALSLNVELLNL